MTQQEKRLVLKRCKESKCYMELARFLALEFWKKQERFTDKQFTDKLISFIGKPNTISDTIELSRIVNVATDDLIRWQCFYSIGGKEITYFPNTFDEEFATKIKQYLLV